MFAARNMLFARSGFDPLSLSPALWLSDTGSDPSVWPDISGNGRNATQGTPANRPAIITNALNGRQVRRFDGTNDFLTQGYRSIFRNIAGITLFVVCKPTSLGSSERALFSSIIGGAPSEKHRCFLGVDNLAQPSGFNYGGRRLDGDFGDFNQSSSDYNGSSFYSVTTQHRHSSAQKQLWINGTSNHLDTSFQTTGSTSDTDSAYDTHIGRYSNPASAFFQGDIAEILVFPTALSDAQRQSVENYLNNKWTIY